MHEVSSNVNLCNFNTIHEKRIELLTFVHQPHRIRNHPKVSKIVTMDIEVHSDDPKATKISRSDPLIRIHGVFAMQNNTIVAESPSHVLFFQFVKQSHKKKLFGEWLFAILVESSRNPLAFTTTVGGILYEES